MSAIGEQTVGFARSTSVVCEGAGRGRAARRSYGPTGRSQTAVAVGGSGESAERILVRQQVRAVDQGPGLAGRLDVGRPLGAGGDPGEAVVGPADAVGVRDAGVRCQRVLSGCACRGVVRAPQREVAEALDAVGLGGEVVGAAGGSEVRLPGGFSQPAYTVVALTGAGRDAIDNGNRSPHDATAKLLDRHQSGTEPGINGRGGTPASGQARRGQSDPEDAPRRALPPRSRPRPASASVPCDGPTGFAATCPGP
jgi:hypothetical protein